MIVRNKEIKITCSVCKKTFSFFVNEDAYEEYVAGSDKSTKELFPHLMDEEIDLIETNICENCI